MTPPSHLEVRDPAFVLRQHAGRETLRVCGPDRQSWLNGLLTADVTHVSSETGCFGLSLNRTGKIQSDVWCVANEQELWFSVAAERGASVYAEFDRMLIMEDAELSVSSAEFSWLTAHGTGAVDWVRAAVASSAGGVHAWGRVALTADDDAVLVCEPPVAQRLLSEQPERVLSDESWLDYRLRCGWPEYGVDYDNKERPHEAGLERKAISWSKGCYLGQEVVCMQDMRGKVKRSLRCYRAEAREGYRVTRGEVLLNRAGDAVGTVKSAAYNEELGVCSILAQIELSVDVAELGVASAPELKWTLLEASPRSGQPSHEA